MCYKYSRLKLCEGICEAIVHIDNNPFTHERCNLILCPYKNACRMMQLFVTMINANFKQFIVQNRR